MRNINALVKHHVQFATASLSMAAGLLCWRPACHDSNCLNTPAAELPFPIEPC